MSMIGRCTGNASIVSPAAPENPRRCPECQRSNPARAEQQPKSFRQILPLVGGVVRRPPNPAEPALSEKSAGIVNSAEYPKSAQSALPNILEYRCARGPQIFPQTCQPHHIAMR